APSAVAALQPVEVAAADDLRGPAVLAEQYDHHIAVAVRGVAVDVAGVGGDVVGVHLGGGGVAGVGPGGVVGAGADGGAVLVAGVEMVGAGDQVDVVAVAAACVAGDAVQDLGAIGEVAHIAPQRLQIAAKIGAK